MATAPLKLYTYLNFGGNCEEAFRFYESISAENSFLK